VSGGNGRLSSPRARAAVAITVIVLLMVLLATVVSVLANGG
jgi:hypothetical protein